MMIVSRNPVKSALFLVLSFFTSAVLWLMIQAEFLALILIFVYVGAVMTLFLFVVMMLYLEPEKLKGGFVRYFPFALLVVAGMVGLMIYVIAPEHFGKLVPVVHGADYSNIKDLGSVLYTDYVYPVELAAVLLLIAIISAISLTHAGKPNRKVQDVNKQLTAKRDEHVRLVDMPAEKRDE